MIIKHDFGNPGQGRAKAGGDPGDGGRGFRTLMAGFGGLESFGGGSATLFMALNRFMALTAPEFFELAPNLVLTPLVSGPHDAIDFARKLDRLGYAGRYCAVVDRLPDAGIVRREIRGACPAIDFDIRELCGEDPSASRLGA